MSNLGSVGSKDFTSEAKTPIVPNGGDLNNNSTDSSISQVYTLFQSPNPTDHTSAMKMLLALMSKGTNVGEFTPLVVQQVASHDPMCRQLAYVFLNHYADESLDTVVLSINTFQRALTDSDPILRALAIKVMSSISTREILPAINEAINQVIGDPSPYVKKAAAFAMIKASELAEDPSENEIYFSLIERLLLDNSPITFSGAITAYWYICPDSISLLHPHFRSICQNISKLDPYAQLFTLRSLTVYARYCFKNPSLEDEDNSTTAFWDEGPTKESISADHLLLIHSAKKLLSSPNNSVVMAAVVLLFYIAPSSHITSVARPLVRMLYDSPLIAQLSLTTILSIASYHNHIFVPHLNHFFIRRDDSTDVKKLKLRVLALLASPSNAEIILNELSNYTGSYDLEFAASAVKTMGKTAMVNESIIPVCLLSLLRLMGRAEGPVLSEVVLVIAHILRKRRGTEDEAQALRQLCRKFLEIKDPNARAAVLSIVGDMHETHSEFAPQLLRFIAQNFLDEPGEVRLQALTLSAKLIACGIDQTIPMYVLLVGERDIEFDIRDRAIFLLALVNSKSEEIKNNLKDLLFPERKAPTWTSLDNNWSEFQLGTFSHFFNKSMSDYEPLPDWSQEENLPDEQVRQPLNKEGEYIGNNKDIKDNVELSDFFSGDDDNEKSEYYSGYYYEEEEENSNNENDNFYG